MAEITQINEMIENIKTAMMSSDQQCFVKLALTHLAFPTFDLYSIYIWLLNIFLHEYLDQIWIR